MEIKKISGTFPAKIIKDIEKPWTAVRFGRKYHDLWLFSSILVEKVIFVLLFFLQVSVTSKSFSWDF